MVPKSVLPPTWEVPADFRERLGEKVGRQRAMLAEGHLLLVLHRPPKRDEAERYARLFWRKPDGTWQSNELGNGPTALSRHMGDFAELVERYDRQEDHAQSVADYFGILESVSPLHRTVRNLHAVLQDAREKLSSDRDLINFRDKAYDLERAAELLVTDVRNALEFATAKKAEEQASASHEMAVASHRLNLLAAFFFPIATLSAIFDTSLKHPLEQYIDPPYAFYSVILLGLLLGVALAGYLVGTPVTPSKPLR
jgi:hypothetical protein